MSMQHFSAVESTSPKPAKPLLGRDVSSRLVGVEPFAFSGGRDRYINLLAGRKEKLAVDTAAMLGLAIFYQWREERLAQEDPAEFDRLRRVMDLIKRVDASPQEHQHQDNP